MISIRNDRLNIVSFFLLFTICNPLAAAGSNVPQNIYELDLKLETSEAKTISFASFKGSPLIIALFYASCPSACPLIINNIKSLQRRAEISAKDDVKILIVSIDPDTDTPQKLKEVVKRHRLKLKRWTVARTSANEVEDLAAVLGIKYKKVAASTFQHTSLISIISADGQILKQSENYAADKDQMADTLKSALTGARGT